MRYTLLSILGILFFLQHTLTAQPIIELEQVSESGLGQIVGIHHAGDERMFLVIQSGIIRIMSLDGEVADTPFLDIRQQVQSGGERGLLGLAFHPNYTDNGQFFLNYTRSGGASIISRWSVSDEDPNVADMDSEEVLLTIPQPFANHNGGDIRFGPDGLLYIGMGDGGSGGDPQDFGQDSLSLLGKMLRINVDGESGYTIPQDNPFVGNPDVLDEIWALGLRNPWRFSFDASTGDLWIADVGQNAIEEINMAPAGSTGGENYGWRCYEGTDIFNDEDCLSADNYTFPVFEYNHSQGDRSITGGFVYRGEDFPALQGVYIFADFVSSRYFRLVGEQDDYSSEIINTSGVGAGGPSTFGEDFRGELYSASYFNGAVFRIKDFCQAYTVNLAESEDGSLLLTLESAEWSDDFTIDWYLDDMLVQSGADSVLVPEVGGLYSAILTHERGCVMSSDTVQVISTGLQDEELQAKVQVWPNPIDQQMNVRNTDERTLTARLIDIHGRILDTQILPAQSLSTWSVDVSSGIYILQIASENGQAYNKRLIKK